MDDGLVADADDVVSEQHELRVVIDVGGALCTDVVRAVDLKHEAVADQQVDPMPGDPHLPPERKAHPPQSRDDHRLEA